jgi:hypothetical protein
LAFTLDEAKTQIKAFVEALSNVPDLQFNPDAHPSLLFDPYDRTGVAYSLIAHYFLLIASIDAGFAIGFPESARRLGVHLHSELGERLFTASERDFAECISRSRMPAASPSQTARLLAGVNSTVRQHGDIFTYASKHRTPSEFAEALATDMPTLGGPHTARKRIWMYLRWMVRDRPDLRIFHFFDPRQLYVPLDRNVAKVGVSLGLLDDLSEIAWPQVEKVTEFARSLFPEDPAKVDYAFFLAGREMSGKVLNLGTLLSSTRSILARYRLS